MQDERRAWLARTPDEALARRLETLAWVVSALVLGLVVAMQSIRIPLPAGWSTAFLPPFHAAVNALGAVVLAAAFVFVRQGRIEWHRRAMLVAMGLSVLFLLSYVAYHITNDPTRYGGEGPLRAAYFFLLITHIVAAAVSFPFILFTFIAAWTSRFARHRRLARWVFPLWFYVAVSGPLCYLMLRPYY